MQHGASVWRGTVGPPHNRTLPRSDQGTVSCCAEPKLPLHRFLGLPSAAVLRPMHGPVLRFRSLPGPTQALWRDS